MARRRGRGRLCNLGGDQWFEKTGEVWGVGGGFLFEQEGRITLATGYVFKHWLRFLERNSLLALERGGSLPIHVRLGVNGLANSWWPQGRYAFNDEGYGAVENACEYAMTLISTERAYLESVAVDAFNGPAAVYGIEPHTLDQIMDLSW